MQLLKGGVSLHSQQKVRFRFRILPNGIKIFKKSTIRKIVRTLI